MLSEGRILVIDDTPANLEVISETLTEAGYTVATAIDGERALKRLQTYIPDLILLDVQMPGIDGFETCSRLKSNPNTADIPVIFITALSDTDSKVKGFSLGAVDYITKPFQEQEMLARISTHLQLRNLSLYLEQRVAERTAELETALEQLRQSQLQLVQSEKMSALGNLVAGVAHEINNPTNFIAGNLQPAQDYIQDLLKLLGLYQAELLHPSTALQAVIEAIDLDYLLEDLPKLMASMRTGVERMRHITNSLRTFSRSDTERATLFNLHEGIESTLTILMHRLKANQFRPAIQVVRNYGAIPEVECYAGQINQVFMNILANAIDALDESSQKYCFEKLETNLCQITVCTELTENQQQVQIRIQDNGVGMSKDIQHAIFDYLFTTKAVGKGTGLGLAIARQIIVEKHQGTICVNSVPGLGTEFCIEIPLKTGINITRSK